MPIVVRKEARALVVAKRSVASEFRRVLAQRAVSQAELARRMRTSRVIVSRLLKGDDQSVTLTTVAKAAAALGCQVKFRLGMPPAA